MYAPEQVQIHLLMAAVLERDLRALIVEIEGKNVIEDFPVVTVPGWNWFVMLMTRT